jgi:aminocarboxymuconate-semialdehyde decarboxylase
MKRDKELAIQAWGAEAAEKLAASVKDLMPKLTTPEERIIDMDRMGVDIQALSPSPVQYCYWADKEEAEEIVRLCNDNIAEICHSYPERFVGLGHVAIQHPDLAVEQMEVAVRDLGLRGFEVSSLINGKELSDQEFRPVWAKAEELNVPVFLHPLGSPLGARLAPYYLSNIVGQPMETAIALSMIIFSGLLDEHPNLKIIAAHGGGYLPLYSGRSDHGHAVRDEACECARPPREYLKQIFYDSIVYHPAALADLLNRVGVDQVMIGTDYPFDMAETDPLSLVSEIDGLDERSCAAILGGNASALLGLESRGR